MKSNTIYGRIISTQFFNGNTYKGFQSGYEVSFSAEGLDFFFQSENGIRGINVPVTIEFDDLGVIRLSY